MIDCCMYIFEATSSGLVSMMFFCERMESKGGISIFLNTLRFIFFGLVLYSCQYLEISFLT
jgi:hypothetical protein